MCLPGTVNDTEHVMRTLALNAAFRCQHCRANVTALHSAELWLAPTMLWLDATSRQPLTWNVLATKLA